MGVLFLPFLVFYMNHQIVDIKSFPKLITKQECNDETQKAVKQLMESTDGLKVLGGCLPIPEDFPGSNDPSEDSKTPDGDNSKPKYKI